MSPAAVSPKPTIVAYPGAFHASVYMDGFAAALREAGYEAEAHYLTTPDHPERDVLDDEAAMKAAMKPHIDAGKDVVLLVHSYAGIPGCGAVSGLAKSTRETRGEKGGLVGIVYIAAFIPENGESTVQSLLGGFAPWHVPDFEAGLLRTKDEFESFYADCDPEVVAPVLKAVRGHSLKSLGTSPSCMGMKEKAFDGRRAYIKCLKDGALPPPTQDALMAKSGVEWVVRSMDSSHSPFLSFPKETIEVLQGLFEEFYAA